MKRTNKIILMIVFVSLLLLGIGYAAIQNITLTISGKADVEVKQDNFNVGFLNTEIEVSDSNFITAGIVDNTTATINVEGLSQVGENVYAIYTIKNESTDLSSDLSVATTNDNPEYFEILAQLEKTSLVAGDETTVKVSVKLLKIPIEAKEEANISVVLTAMPVQPGEEGTSEGIKDFSQTPELNKYGFYYDRFYCNKEENLGFIIHEDESVETFEIKSKENYPDLEKDEWFCVDYIPSGEFNLEEELLNGASVQNDGKTIIDVSGVIYTMSSVVPHGIYMTNRYSFANESGDIDVLTYREDGTMNSILCSNDGTVKSDVSVSDYYFKVVANGFILEEVGENIACFNLTGDLLLYNNEDLYKLDKIHNYVPEKIKDATCTEDGEMKYTCSKCNDYYTVAITAYNHKFDHDFDSVCDNCGETIIIEDYYYCSLEKGIIDFITGYKDSDVTEINIPPRYYNPAYMEWFEFTGIKNYALDRYSKLTTITIPNTIKTIEAGTFEYCDLLTTVNYTGTKEQWNAIQIGSGNDPLINATINYNYEMPIE